MRKYKTTKKAQPPEDEFEPYPDYPVYPPEEDIFDNFEEEDLDPDKIVEPVANPVDAALNEDSDIDLDIPGSELDDIQEVIGSEDEENNYYSLGGDNHKELDENYN